SPCDDPRASCIEALSSLHDARAMMRHHSVHHLPVTRSGVWVGLLTERDVNLLLGPDYNYPSERELTAGTPWKRKLVRSMRTRQCGKLPKS
ncbi:MAG: CBS domain-containing protein, partial [Gammaproteobacteria bacterium]